MRKTNLTNASIYRKRYANPSLLFAAIFCLLSTTASAQLELIPASYQPSQNGPTSASQTATFFRQSSGTVFIPALPALAVTASLGNQQYSNVAVIGNGLVYGAVIQGLPAATFQTMNMIGGGVDEDFTSVNHQPETGISVTENSGFFIYATADPLIGQPLNGRFLYGTLTLTFSRPVSNPVIHVVGIGSTVGAHGASTEFELTTANVTLSRLSGSPQLTVENNKILNNSAVINAACGSGAACGSVLAQAENITTLSFNVYMRGDGLGDMWSTTNGVNGDNFIVSVSVNEDDPMPITGLSMVATKVGGKALLQWSTVSEQGTSHFIIERSSDGKHFTTIGNTKAAGNSNSLQHYSFTDAAFYTGIVYYRVKTVDLDGRTSSSKTVLLNLGSFEDIRIFPNPAKDRVYIALPKEGRYALTLYNVQGQSIKQLNSNTLSGQVMAVDRNNLPAGVYLLRVNNAANGQQRDYKIVWQ
jgi:hypothetical protein